MPFDRSVAANRLERLWGLSAQFGTERGANRVYLDEIVSDRMQLTSGLQVIRDELQLMNHAGGVNSGKYAITIRSAYAPPTG